MDLIAEAITEAWRLLRTGDNDVYGITIRTAAITGTSTLVALEVAVVVLQRLHYMNQDKH